MVTGLRSDGRELPVIGVQGSERADAARNREKALCAARRLFKERGPANVSMDDVAEAAGIGKGTLYRRFGDRSGLAFAVLEDSESAFQEACIRGEPPLGPGALPAERLVAFGRGLLELFESHGDVKLAAELGGGGRGDSPVLAFYATHLALLLRELDPELDAEYLAQALLAALSSRLVAFLRYGAGMSRERVAAGYETLVRALAARPAAQAPGSTPGQPGSR